MLSCSVFSYFLECTGKVTPLHIIGGNLLEERHISVASPHGEQIIFDDRYSELLQICLNLHKAVYN